LANVRTTPNRSKETGSDSLASTPVSPRRSVSFDPTVKKLLSDEPSPAKVMKVGKKDRKDLNYTVSRKKYPWFAVCLNAFFSFLCLCRIMPKLIFDKDRVLREVESNTGRKHEFHDSLKKRLSVQFGAQEKHKCTSLGSFISKNMVIRGLNQHVAIQHYHSCFPDAKDIKVTILWFTLVDIGVNVFSMSIGASSYFYFGLSPHRHYPSA
jgi:hypothetical protein